MTARDRPASDVRGAPRDWVIMNELTSTYALAALIAVLAAFQILTRRFDPFAPIWLFLVGIFQVYVVQAISYHDWAIRVRGSQLVSEAGFRSLWAVAWMLGVYFLGPGRVLARILPTPPRRWSIAAVNVASPILCLWGMTCGILVIRGAEGLGGLSAEQTLLISFPSVMLVSGILLIVTGRQVSRPRPAYVAAGIGVVLSYMLIWMINGKRSHSLIAVLTSVCAFYVARLRRPSWPVLLTTALAGAMSVGLAIGWRYYAYREGKQGSVSDFASFVSTFDPSIVLESFNLTDGESLNRASYETEEIGGFYLMMDTVPLKADYDYGANYLRIFSTYIPRIVWPDKPIFGRDQWTAAWMAGSELKRDALFTGPAIGILGATQLNGGAWGTFLVMGVIGLALRTAYEFFRLHADCPWVQVWWTLTYYNAWLMTVGDDPLAWFYYNYGFTMLPPLAAFWLFNKFAPGEAGTIPA